VSGEDCDVFMVKEGRGLGGEFSLGGFCARKGVSLWVFEELVMWEETRVWDIFSI
jgi:hypothetical protein